MDHGREREGWREVAGAAGQRFVLSVRGERGQREVRREACAPR